MALLDQARKLGVSRGVFGDSRPWLIIGGLAWGIRAIQWARRPMPHVLLREVLEPGETLVIEHQGPPPTRRQRRSDDRARRRLARRELRGTLETARTRHRNRIL